MQSWLCMQTKQLTDSPESVFIDSGSAGTSGNTLTLLEGSVGPQLSCGSNADPEAQYKWYLLPAIAQQQQEQEQHLQKTQANSDLLSTTSTVNALGSLDNSNFRKPKLSSRRSTPISGTNNNDGKLVSAFGIANAINQSSGKPFNWLAAIGNQGANDSFGALPKIANNFLSVGGTSQQEQIVSGSLQQQQQQLENNNNKQSGLIEITDSELIIVKKNPNSASSLSILDLSQSNLDRRQSGHYICEASNRLGQSSQSIYVNVQCK